MSDLKDYMRDMSHSKLADSVEQFIRFEFPQVKDLEVRNDVFDEITISFTSGAAKDEIESSLIRFKQEHYGKYRSK